VRLRQAPWVSNPRASCDRFRVADLTEDLEVHPDKLPSSDTRAMSIRTTSTARTKTSLQPDNAMRFTCAPATRTCQVQPLVIEPLPGGSRVRRTTCMGEDFFSNPNRHGKQAAYDAPACHTVEIIAPLDSPKP
jgi:hypothetical protein